MRNYGRTSIYELLGDLVVYRNLVPADRRLPPLKELSCKVGLPTGTVPRKSTPEYANVIVHLLQLAQAIDKPGINIARLIYLGDTRLLDGTAFANISRVGGWPGLAFIGAERDDPPCAEVLECDIGTLYIANRWSALAEFDHFRQKQEFPIDEQTAVVIDLDKTALGARGRNDHVIDQARIEAVHCTVSNLLGSNFNAERFQTAYNQLNQPEFHPFTADNQDYLTYICLMLSSGLFSLESLVAEIRAGQITTFAQFITQVEERAAELPPNLLSTHRQIYAFVQQGDPTPFKAFRYNEYQTTIKRMGCLEDSASVTDLLSAEIVITKEVLDLALSWREQGALLFGLSDKPDEASTPTKDLAAKGYQALHRTETHIIGD